MLNFFNGKYIWLAGEYEIAVKIETDKPIRRKLICIEAIGLHYLSITKMSSEKILKSINMVRVFLGAQLQYRQ